MREFASWVHHGPVTPGFAKWTTTAEQVGGKTYIYYDFPNDQDPHLFIDDDLTDGKPGKNMGLAFADPSDGSDCAVIRDLNGKFHIIYENWSPIHAGKHSWDSPLAGHSISPNGMHPFKILDPAIDHRTKPTGKMAKYNHPHWTKEDPKRFPTSVAEYEIHEPEQDAYGDWADRSKSMVRLGLELSKKNGLSNLVYKLGDLEKVPLKDGSVDLALMSQSLHHAEYPETALEEAARILKPGGQLIIIDLKQHQFEKARELYSDRWLGFAENELYKFIKEAGFSKVKVDTVAKENKEPFFETLLATAEKNR